MFSNPINNVLCLCLSLHLTFQAAGDAEMAARRAAFRRDNAPRALAELGGDILAPFKGNHPRPPPPTPDASSDA